MNKLRRPPFTTLFVAFAFSISLWPVSKTTADDAASPAAQRLAEQKFDETFFDTKRDPSVEAARIRLSRVLQKRIEAIHRSCELNDSQTRKLELVGRGAIKRLIDSIAEKKKTFLSERKDDLAALRYLSESSDVLALRKNLRDGPFDEGSLFAKTIGNVLTPEQAAKYSKRSALAARSGRTITRANVGDVVRIAEIQKDIYRVAWDRDGKYVGCLEYNKQLDVYLPLADQPARTIGQGRKILAFDFGHQSGPSRHPRFRWERHTTQLARGQETRNTNWSGTI